MREKSIVAPLTLTQVRVPGNGRTDTFLACPHGCRTPSTAYTAMPLICACREATIRKIDRTSRRKPGFRRLLEATDLPDHLICCRGLIPNDARRAPLHCFTTPRSCSLHCARHSFLLRVSRPNLWLLIVHGPGLKRTLMENCCLWAWKTAAYGWVNRCRRPVGLANLNILTWLLTHSGMQHAACIMRTQPASSQP